MRQEKGLTLIEALTAIVVLGIAIIAVTVIVQNTTVFSKNNDNADKALQVTRTVMEEIKYKLKGANTLTIYGQTVSLQALREQPPPYALPPIYYPDSSDPQLELVIESKVISNSVYAIKGQNFDLAHYFRLVSITSTNPTNGQSQHFETYVDCGTCGQ